MNTIIQPTHQRVSFILRPYTILELSKLYGVCKRTFRKWLKPFTGEIGERQGYYYTVLQVQIIIDKIGLPMEMISE